VFTAAEYLMRRIQRRQEEAASGQVSLFAAASQTVDLEPVKLPDIPEWPSLEKLQNEFAAVGFYLSAHPVDNYGEWLDKKGYTTYRQIAETQPPMRGGKIAGVVVKKVEKKSDRGRFAFVTISGRTGVFDVTVYTEPLTQYRDLFVAGNILSMSVDVQWREEEPRLILSSAAPLDQLISRSINNVQINLTKSADPEKLAKFLAQCGQGNIKVAINLPMKEMDAVVTLQPDHGIKLMESDIQEIRKFSGVEVVVQ
jgi:DNA polymerase-3 subunit alpha